MKYSKKYTIYNSIEKIKCVGINLTKHVQDFYTEKYVIFIKEIRDKEMEKHILFMN